MTLRTVMGLTAYRSQSWASEGMWSPARNAPAAIWRVRMRTN